MEAQGGLQRSLSFPLLVLYGLGTALGAGIYVLIGKGSQRAQQVSDINEAPVLQGCFEWNFLIDPSENDQIVPRE